MGAFVLQQGYGLSAQLYGLVFAVNALGIVGAGRLSAALVERVGPRRLLLSAVTTAMVATLVLLAGVLVSGSVWVVLPPLFVVVACVGLIMPNATALAMAGQARAAGAASALIGLLQFSVGAVVPPLASAGGVGPVVMGVAMAATATAAVIVALLIPRGPRPG